MTKHHLTPKCHYREDKYWPMMNSPENLLKLWNDKHEAWHTLFKEMSIEQTIAVLQRVCRLKRRFEKSIRRGRR